LATEPYWSRPDLAISADDVQVEGDAVRVTVHNVGAVDAPPSRVVIRDAQGTTVGGARVESIRAPHDLLPKTVRAVVQLPAGAQWRRGTVTVEPGDQVREITRRNNRVEVGSRLPDR
jgi:hypothetical protein